jgi:hydroxymethylbilane synthase
MSAADRQDPVAAPIPSGTAGAPGAAMRPLRVATRRSALARAQSHTVGTQLAALTGRTLELVEVTTRGDIDPAPLAQIGGTGVFVTAVRQAVAEGHADAAVHSLKDLPTTADPRLLLAAVPRREDPRDVLVARGSATLEDLAAGARVGTGSPRRQAQLEAHRPDLEVVPIRGNVDSRVARVTAQPTADDPGLAAVVLAAAGMARLGRQDEVSQVLEPDLMMPAPGQGALAVEVRADVADADPELAAALRDLDDPATRAAVTAERALLSALEVGCSAPVGALAEVRDDLEPEPTVRLRAVAQLDGRLVRVEATGPAARADQLGRALAARILADRIPVTGPDADREHDHRPIPAVDRIPVTGPTTAHRGSSQ